MAGQPLKREAERLRAKLAAVTAERDELLGVQRNNTSVPQPHVSQQVVPKSTLKGAELMEESKSKIINALRIGTFRTVAARSAGISPSTLRTWMKRGASEKEGPFADFRRDILNAEAQAELLLMGEHFKIIKEGDLRLKAQAIQFMLTHRWQNRWGERKSTELVGAGGGPVELRTTATVDARAVKEELRRALQAMDDAKEMGVDVIDVKALPERKNNEEGTDDRTNQEQGRDG